MFRTLCRFSCKFETRFGFYKCDIKTKKERCGSSRHFNKRCHDTNLITFSSSKFKLLNRYIKMTWRILRTFYGAGKSTSSPSYLP